MLWTIIAIFAVVILLFTVRRKIAYKKLFADEHILEIAQGVQNLKLAAHANIEKVGQQEAVRMDDARLLITSQKLRVFYTISVFEEQNIQLFEHHYTIGITQGYTAKAVGENFSLYIAHLLGFTSQEFSIERSQNGVYHVMWQLSPKAQKTFAKRAVKIPTRHELPALYDRIARWRKVVFVQQTEIPLLDLKE